VSAHPPLALGLARPPGRALTPRAIRELAAARLSHLHLTLEPGRPGATAHWRAAVASVRRLGPEAGLAVTLVVPPEAAPLAAFARALAAARVDFPLRWLVVATGSRATTPAVWRAVRKLWRAHRLPGLLGAGTAEGFVNLNRERPFTAGADFAGYCLDAQVHAWDEASLLETPALQTLTARQASALVGGLPLVVDPVGFGAPRDGRPASRGDPRVRGTLGGLWTLASLAALTGTAVRSATYHATHGPAGILPASRTAAASPAWRVLRACGEFRAAGWSRVHSAAPRDGIFGLALRAGRRCRLLLGNSGAHARRVRLGFLQPARQVLLPARRCVQLDGTLR
jgi:D-apionolactonase